MESNYIAAQNGMDLEKKVNDLVDNLVDGSSNNYMFLLLMPFLIFLYSPAPFHIKAAALHQNTTLKDPWLF